MPKIKSLLLGSAAGLLAVTGAQAADLPIIEAEPVDYVRVCDAYGAGFFYIPGTETCLKIGGYVRAEAYVHESNVYANRWVGSPFVVGQETAGGFATTYRDLPSNNNTLSFRGRGYVTFDARTETEMGLLRSFIAFEGTATDQDAGAVIVEKAFLQFAGFTAGLAPSVLAFETVGAYRDHAILDDDVIQFSYTAQFGGGFSATIGAEDRVRTTTPNVAFFQPGFGGAPDFGVPGGITAFYGDGARDQLPALVANLRVDQGWGSAMIGGAAFQSSTRVTAGGTFIDPVTGDPRPVDQFSDREFGWAVTGGVSVNTPFLSEGGKFVVRGTYGEGANFYVASLFAGGFQEVSFLDQRPLDAAGVPFLPAGSSPFDFVDVNQNEAFSLYAGLTHFWTPRLRSNFAASYLYADDQVSNTAVFDPVSGLAVRENRRNDVHAINASANIIYSPVQNLDVGLEVFYTRVERDFDSTVLNSVNVAPDHKDDALGAIFRVQRNF